MRCGPSFLWLQLNDRIKVQQSRPDFLGNVNLRWIESPHIRGKNHSESKCRHELIQCIPWNSTPESLIVFHTLSNMQPSATATIPLGFQLIVAHVSVDEATGLAISGYKSHRRLRELTPDLHHSESLYMVPI